MKRTLSASPLSTGEPFMVQLVNSENTCWEATFTAPAAQNTEHAFSDRSE